MKTTTKKIGQITFTFPRHGYVCVGDVCGWCGRVHRTREAAERHIEATDRAVKRNNGANAYTDRTVYRV